LTNSVKTILFKMKNLGATIRKLREEKKLPLRIVAAYLDIDQAILSKIERGQRNATRAQVVKLAKYFKVKEDELLIGWLSDKLVYEISNEAVGLKALQVAEEKVKYGFATKSKSQNFLSNTILETIKTILKTDGRINAAWLFGSVVRGEATPESDLDIMVEMNAKKKYSMFDLMDLAFIIETKLKRKVDLVEKGYLKPFAKKTAAKEMVKIYG